jgi:hypothetical protein
MGRKDLRQNLENGDVIIYTDFSKGLLIDSIILCKNTSIFFRT